MINVGNRMRGFYKLETFKAEKAEGELRERPGSRRTLAEFENLITDKGLNKLGTAFFYTVLLNGYVGNGSAPPTVNDTGMGNFVASTTAELGIGRAQTSVEPWYIATKAVYRFRPGEVVGSLSEVGMGWNANPSGALFSRALIQDADGNPISISAIADEYLEVTYEMRVYPDLSDSTGTVTIGGVDYNYIARPAQITGSLGWGSGAFGCKPSAIQHSQAYSGEIGPLNWFPDGSVSNSGGVRPGTYEEGSLRGWADFYWRTTKGNFGTGLRSILVSVGWTRWQIQFNAVSDGSAIPKNPDKELKITVAHSWARS